jgi:N-acetylmuramidase
MEFTGAALPLTAADVTEVAAQLGCEPAAIWAVCDVESAGSGFLPDKRPRILFEAHVFGKLTRHRFDAAHPNVSAPLWNWARYGAGGAHQYDRLAEAIAIADGQWRTAALESASWGLFQILGVNFGQCGFAAVEEYVAAMCDSERRHLMAFTEFCRRGGLDRFLRARDWIRFALGYNGPAEANNGYDTKLAAAYRRRAAGAPRPRPAASAHPAPTADNADDDAASAEALNRAELDRLKR